MGGEAGRIFVSYRREDTRHMAGRLADRIDFRFGPGTVFMDVDAIEPGADFTRTIADAVSSCDLLIALIGPEWLVLDERTGEPRIHEHDDFVAIEIKVALDRGIRVIPVLVDQATMPTNTQLPAALRPLATRNATRIDHETFSSDVERFLAAVDRILRSIAAERTAPQQRYRPPTRHPDLAYAQPEPQQSTAGPAAPGSIGMPPTDPSSAEIPFPASGPRIPPLRVALRIALWWVVYVISLFTAFAISARIAWPPQNTSPSIGVITFLLVVLLIVGAVLAREIYAQRNILRRLGPDGEFLLSHSAVSVKNVSKVAVICAVVVLVFGLLVATSTPPPTTTGSSGGTGTTR